MGNIRFRNTGLGGLSGIKFRRNLLVSWSIENLTEANIVGEQGNIIDAIVFADPASLNINRPALISNIEFKDFKLNASISLKSSTNKRHKIITGPLFKSSSAMITKDIYNLTTLGAWVPNLPLNEELILTISNLILDDVYQVRCVFLSGKIETSSSLTLQPNNYNIEFNNSIGIVAVAEFIASSNDISIRIKSNDNKQPFINAIIIRKTGTIPRTTMTNN